MSHVVDTWKNRILAHAEVNPRELMENPLAIRHGLVTKVCPTPALDDVADCFPGNSVLLCEGSVARVPAGTVARPYLADLRGGQPCLSIAFATVIQESQAHRVVQVTAAGRPLKIVERVVVLDSVAMIDLCSSPFRDATPERQSHQVVNEEGVLLVVAPELNHSIALDMWSLTDKPAHARASAANGTPNFSAVADLVGKTWHRNPHTVRGYTP